MHALLDTTMPAGGERKGEMDREYMCVRGVRVTNAMPWQPRAHVGVRVKLANGDVKSQCQPPAACAPGVDDGVCNMQPCMHVRSCERIDPHVTYVCIVRALVPSSYIDLHVVRIVSHVLVLHKIKIQELSQCCGGVELFSWTHLVALVFAGWTAMPGLGWAATGFPLGTG